MGRVVAGEDVLAILRQALEALHEHAELGHPADDLVAALAACAPAIVSGGVRVRPVEPYVALTATLERPDINLFGVRWGPLVTITAHADMGQDSSAEVLAGVGGAFVPAG